METIEIKDGLLVVTTTIPEKSSKKFHSEVEIDQSLIEAEGNVAEYKKKLTAAEAYLVKMQEYKAKFKE